MLLTYSKEYRVGKFNLLTALLPVWHHPLSFNKSHTELLDV